MSANSSTVTGMAWVCPTCGRRSTGRTFWFWCCVALSGSIALYSSGKFWFGAAVAIEDLLLGLGLMAAIARARRQTVDAPLFALPALGKPLSGGAMLGGRRVH